MLALALVVVAATMGLTNGAPGPGWLRWALQGVLALVVIFSGLTLLLGPLSRRLAGESRHLTVRERKRLTPKDRIEAVNHARATMIQAVTGLVVVGSLIFTGAGIVYTARTLDVSARTLDATREGQVTDRYTQAVEQLGSPSIDVRLGGIYALERLVYDSPRDLPTVLQVLVAYVRVHAQPPSSRRGKGQAFVDVAAALYVLSRLDPRPRIPRAFDLRAIDFSGLNLTGVDLSRADLRKANLSGTVLIRANLSEARLAEANLTQATLNLARLDGADLTEADLSQAIQSTTEEPVIGSRPVDLTNAFLQRAILTRAKLQGAVIVNAYLGEARLDHADLTDAYLLGSDLYGADLTEAILEGTDLKGAGLRSSQGPTPEEIKSVAITNQDTKFVEYAESDSN